MNSSCGCGSGPRVLRRRRHKTNMVADRRRRKGAWSMGRVFIPIRSMMSADHGRFRDERECERMWVVPAQGPSFARIKPQVG